MGLDDRITYMLLGAVIGFVLGYMVRYLRDIDETVHQVEDIVREEKDEIGSISMTYLKNFALMIVVLATVYAAFASQSASNSVKDTQKKLQLVVSCNQEYLAKTINALNQRTQYSLEQTDKNIALQRAQADYLNVVLEIPDAGEIRTDKALRLYFEKLTGFATVSGKQTDKILTNPYPTNTELLDCIAKKMEKS